MMICGIVFTVISQCILLPIVFSVHRTNNKVLSMFGYIHVKDVKVLEKRCEDYIQDHLQDDNLKKAVTEDVEDEAQEKHEHGRKHEEDVFQKIPEGETD
jgi:hypothetical protein